MALLQQWEKFAQEKQNAPDGGRSFWKGYFETEKSIYERILASKPRKNTVKVFFRGLLARILS